MTKGPELVEFDFKNKSQAPVKYRDPEKAKERAGYGSIAPTSMLD
jgi:hypothetical protein